MSLKAVNETSLSSLELFVRDYVATVGGEWEQVEPQVYDLLLPDSVTAALTARDPGLTRVTFDPEALPEHPRAQLASLGTPLVDALLHDAVERARFVELHLDGLNLQSRGWVSTLNRAYSLEGVGALEATSARPLDFPQVVFWFEVTFASDQREQEILPVAIDLHYGRQARHVELLLDMSRLARSPSLVYPTAPLISRDAAYRLAREQVVRTVSALANTRNRELHERLDKQVARMTRYYDDLRHELEDQASRKDADPARFAARREALARERDLRVTELRKKNSLGVRLSLLNVLVVHQPKLAVEARESGRSKATTGWSNAATASLVWDPLTEAWEAAACPLCGRPTFELHRLPRSLACATCLNSASQARTRMPR